jgi:hypothetical protein
MEKLSYDINKGVNRPVEFRGLKAQYIYYLAIGLALLLIAFSIMYIMGIPVFFCLPIVLLAGPGLFMGTYHYSHKYGEHGLMKTIAHKQLPASIISRSGVIFKKLNTRKIGRDK